MISPAAARLSAVPESVRTAALLTISAGPAGIVAVAVSPAEVIVAFCVSLPVAVAVLETALANRERLPRLRFDCGTEDLLIEPNRDLHRALEAAGIAHVDEEFSGGHEWPYWETHLAETLRFFGRTLTG